jgi:glycerol-3-phosphate dehydrogenase
MEVLGDTDAESDLGEYFGANLYARELEYFTKQEWARTPEDVLWRRTKTGLHLKTAQRERVDAWFAARA